MWHILVPETRRATHVRLVGARAAHYGSLWRLAHYRRQFEKTTRQPEEDPSIFAIALETLAVKAFGDMGHMARLCIIWDRFIAGHGSCELGWHLDSVAPEIPIRDIVDCCRVWESHADLDNRRGGRPGPERALPIYTVDDVGGGRDDRTMAAVTTSLDQLESLLRWLLPTSVVPPPPPKPVPSDLAQLLQWLLREAQTLQHVPSVKTGITVIQILLQNLLPVSPSPDSRTQLVPDIETELQCCVPGHGATRCPVLDVSLPG